MTYSIQSGALATEQLQQRLSQLDLTGLLQSAGAAGKLHVLLETPQLVVLFVPPAPGLHQLSPRPECQCRCLWAAPGGGAGHPAAPAT
jgi:hypothetical protein